MPIALRAKILELEDRLRSAMLDSNVAALDELLAPDLVFTNHLGQLQRKTDDLAAHQLGVLKITRLEASELQIRALGDVAVVSVRMSVAGTYAGTPANGDFRFTRVWAHAGREKWQIVAAHSSLIAP